MDNKIIDIKINGTQEFMNVSIPIVKGGFGKNQKVMLAKTIAEIHGVELFNLNKLINNNLNRFRGDDIINLLNSSEEFRNFAKENGLITSNRTKDIYLLSERGYTKLVSMMDNSNNKKWEVMDKLIDEYFAMKEIISKNESLLSVEQSLQLQLFSKDPLDVVNAHKQLVDIKIDEVKPTFIEEGRRVGFTEGFDEGKDIAEEGILLSERSKVFLNATNISKLIGEKLNLPKLRSTNLMMFLEKRNLGKRMAKEGKTYRKFVPNKNFDNIIIKNGWARKTTNGNIEFSIEFADVIAEYDDFKIEISNCIQDYVPTELNIDYPF